MMIEKLEQRRLLAATFELVGSTLHVSGTPGRDTIAFGLSPDSRNVDVNVFVGSDVVASDQFDVNSITLITADLGDGADTFIVGEVTIAVSVNGGQGPDSLSGGQGNDTLLGEGGLDYLFGREGDDILAGGIQADLILGGRNDDTLVAFSTTSSDDTLAGGQGSDTVDYSTVPDAVVVNVGTDLPDPDQDDQIFGDVEIILGSPQNDEITNGTRRGMRIEGGAGDDTLTGGSGSDTLIGGSGVDAFFGKGGGDVIDSADGISEMVNGGRGVDTATVDSGVDALFNTEITFAG